MAGPTGLTTERFVDKVCFFSTFQIYFFGVS